MGQNNVRFIQSLGSGSYGEVYKAKWNGKLVAAKRIHPLLVRFDPGGDNGVVAKFVKECELLRRLEHPNILEVLHIIYEPKKPPILITELLDCDLGKHFSENKAVMPLEELVTIMLDVAEGLEYLHGQDEPIIHRDLCPKNILLDKSNPALLRAKICDIGLAKIIAKDITRQLSPVPGTPDYMAPETYDNPPKYGTEIDVFSFGKTLQEGFIINLENAPAKDEEATVLSQLQADFRKMGEASQLRQLVDECLETDPKKRPRAQDIVKILADPVFLKEIVKYDIQLQKIKVCKDFLQLIPVRRRTIRELEEMNLDEMTAELDEFHRKANIATAAGATTSVLATGLVVGGFISSFFTFGATIPVMIAGGAIAAAGGITTFGAKMAEIVESKTELKKVEDTIAEDKEESENLRKSMEKLDKLIERNVQRIFDKIEELDGTADASPDAILRVMFHFEEIAGMKIMKSEQLHPVKASARVVGAVLAATSSGVTAGTAGARIAGTAVFDALSVASRATHVAGVVASVVSLPIDAYFLVTSVRELKNKSPSEVAEKIRDIQSKMVCPLESDIPSLMNVYVQSKVREITKARFESKNHDEDFGLFNDIDTLIEST